MNIKTHKHPYPMLPDTLAKQMHCKPFKLQQ